VKSQRGFSLIESIIAIAIVMIFILGATYLIEIFQKQSADQKDKVRARTLMTQVSADIAGAPERFPTIMMIGQQVGYVLCFDQNLSAVPFDMTDAIGLKTLTELEPSGSTEGDRPRFCNSKFEVRVTPVSGDPELKITVYQYFAPRSQTTIKRMVSSSSH
jgi:prepilin-type N-terminal cleavage/methylation domain-containing protein